MRRVNEEAVASLTGMPLFDAALETQDALDASRLNVTPVERRVYDLIKRHKGHRNPVSINYINNATGISERKIKDAVAELVTSHKILIGALRGAVSYGYFIIESAEDQEVALAPFRAQILSMLRRMRVLQGAHQVREWLGQQVAEL
jgi:hypothetical protein